MPTFFPYSSALLDHYRKLSCELALLAMNFVLALFFTTIGIVAFSLFDFYFMDFDCVGQSKFKNGCLITNIKPDELCNDLLTMKWISYYSLTGKKVYAFWLLEFSNFFFYNNNPRYLYLCDVNIVYLYKFLIFLIFLKYFVSS